ncbi:MAG: hypothetical protein ACI9KE_006170, partial [Polyangiales bacterium]
WGECMRLTEDDCDGTRTRTISTSTCDGGSCQTVDTTDSESCDIANMTFCGMEGATCDAIGPSETSSCLGRRRRPICMGGTCRTAQFIDCDLIGAAFECSPPETSACSRTGDECVGTETETTYACIAGRMCEPTVGDPTSCNVSVTETCGEAADCSAGMCDGGGSCAPAVDCDEAGACGAELCMGALLCGCDDVGGCECRVL